jgi:alkanesulfonate monooxygenase SsuD/methylene tetrahydromethanopterin reductase-like flavin-dependent oxidoreductase (luciferase family)
MKISMTLPTMAPGCDRAALLAWCRRIDAGPFTSVAAGERVSFPNVEVGVALAAAAAITERVRIVSTLFVAPLHPAAQLAKRVASLDVLSGGRLTLGLGVGGREEDYRATGATFERRHARLDAQVAEMRRIWAGETLVAGTAPIGPAPLQPGGPPILAAAAGAKPLARAARWSDGVLGFHFGPQAAEAEQLVRDAEAAWREAGRAARPYCTTSFWFALGPDAHERLDRYARRYLAVFGDAAARALAARCLSAGDDAFRSALRNLRDAGIDECFLVPTTADVTELDRLQGAVVLC